MATINKTTKPAGTTAAAPAKPTAPAAAPAEAIDISKLTPEQLASLQKQLKAKKAESSGNSKERFVIIDGMLQQKDESGGFKFTTRDIMNALVKENLITTNGSEDEQNEIKKIQARKQFLEKKRDEKGQLVYPEGTFGYKTSALAGFKLGATKVTEWFTPENVATLTPAQKDTILRAVK